LHFNFGLPVMCVNSIKSPASGTAPVSEL
jgi:hypothetical protein